ncbi:uncharacterized protein LOC135555861 isoform X3 [Oncorhynchus masou masou]|uniref:uncharacterized protein LOC135555861 isoform X3 n=1 Tax=Oncorhynchus masou masou TaxID=90313 RepID=UPI003183C73B
MTTPPIPPRKSFLVKSSTVIGSYDLPSLQEDSDNQEENASTNDRDNGRLWNSQTPGAAMSRSQSPFRPNFVTASDRRPQMSEPQPSLTERSQSVYKIKTQPALPPCMSHSEPLDKRQNPGLSPGYGNVMDTQLSQQHSLFSCVSLYLGSSNPFSYQNQHRRCTHCCAEAGASSYSPPPLILPFLVWLTVFCS